MNEEAVPISITTRTNSIDSESSISVSLSSPDPREDAKQKRARQFKFGQTMVYEDFDFEKKDNGTIIIKTVRGLPFLGFKADMLKGICSTLGIKYTGKRVEEMRRDISNTLSVKEELGKVANGSTKNNVKRAPPKDACPVYIKDAGTYDETFLKLVNVILHESARASYLTLFEKYDREDYDTRTPKKEAIQKLTNFYNNPPEDVMALGLDKFPELKERFPSVQDNDPISASEIKEDDMMRCIHHLNKLYRSDRNKKNKSGHHQPFGDYASKSFVLYYHLRLEKSGSAGLENVAYAQLPSNVFNTSESSTVVSNDTSKSTKKRSSGIVETLKKKQLKLLEQKLQQNEKDNDVGESAVERNKAIAKFMSAGTRAALMDQFKKLRQDIRAAEEEEDTEENAEFIAILKAELNNVRSQLGV
ncbi:predicted protein [Chaetoceros tenuissimus]|uniref:Uncharacterized protein n=1 Tax=Chaetoceros tenuissimus TaxID=426638 RepID=A0AAD3CTG7_9STRA|nr:predicted protein [Chaetoceros tenuissimus]